VKALKQECSLAVVWLSWLVVPAVAVVIGVRRGLVIGILVLALGWAAEMVVLRWARRWFPHLAPWLGYGSVADVLMPGNAVVRGQPRVILYTATVCPFCPIIRQRLAALRTTMPFELEEVDVTLRPALVLEKGLRSVPVLEAGGRYLVGNATTAELLAFLQAGAGVPARVG
jgi:hypothetical protein